MDKSVGNYMVKGPYVAEPDQSVQDALEFMIECEIRHLPVVDDERLVGLVSERDLRAAASLPQAKQLVIADVMKQDVFFATKEASLKEVVQVMRDRKLGSTVIVNADRQAIGIFTATDALGVLADLLENNAPERDYLIDDVIEEWEWEVAG
jgi:acetoin utilization protein AcuB